MNKIAPKRIVIYREGVSESQLELMLSTEVALLKEAVEKEFKDIKIVFLTCNNLCNARFYQQQGKRQVNPDRGLVIDRGVVKEDLYDFYMVPHGSRQGI